MASSRRCYAFPPMLIFWATLGLVFHLSGCSHYYLPANRLESPEALGSSRIGRVEPLALESGPDLTASPNQTASGAQQPGSWLHYVFAFTAALSDATDLEARLGPDAPPLLRAKVQLLGPSEDRAEARSFSLGVNGGAGFTSGATDEATGVELSYILVDAGLEAAYRFTGRHLVYAGPSFSYANVSDSARQFGASAGYQCNLEDFFFRAEGDWISGSYGGSRLGGFYAGATLGLNLPGSRE